MARPDSTCHPDTERGAPCTRPRAVIAGADHIASIGAPSGAAAGMPPLEQHKAAYGQFFSATKGEAEDAEGDTTEAAQAMDEARASTSTHAPLSPLRRMHPAHHALQASAVWCARGTLTRAKRAPLLPSQAAQFVDLTCE